MAWVRFFSFWIYPLLTGLLVFHSDVQRSQASRLLVLILIGLAIWSLLEYLLHRYFFHWTPQNPGMRKIIHQLHYNHHQDPRHPGKILVQPLYSLPVSGLLGWGFYWIGGSFLDATGFLTGLWAGFLYYEWVHYRLHLGKNSRGLLKRQRRWHFYHHFVDPDHCFGVTSPLWDAVFGTWASPPRHQENVTTEEQRRKQPPRHKKNWPRAKRPEPDSVAPSERG